MFVELYTAELYWGIEIRFYCCMPKFYGYAEATSNVAEVVN